MAVKVDRQGPRDVILNGSAALKLEEAEKQFARARQVFDGLAWRLARQPEAGVSVPLAALLGRDTTVDVRVICSENGPDVPTLELLYKFDDESVTVLELRAWPGPRPKPL
jgi:hypothetical protein